MLKRVAAVAALSLIPTAVAAAPSHAEARQEVLGASYSCTVSVPSKVSITSPYRTVGARFSAGCLRYAEYASWDVVHPTQGPVNFASYEAGGAAVDAMPVYDWEPLGRLSVNPSMAFDHSWEDMRQNTTSMTVKLGSGLSASSSRSGSLVTVKGNATRYSPTAGRFRVWSGAKVALRKKSCSSCAWTYVKSGTTTSTGAVSLSTRSSAPYWQIATIDTGNTWGRASGTMKR